MTTLKPDNLARFHSSRPYNFFDPQILALHEERYALVRALNATTDLESREKAAKALFKAFGEGCVLALPIWVEWGNHTSIGKETYLGPNATILDTGLVTIGDRTLIGPSLHTATVIHPHDPSIRLGTLGLETNRPISIGDDVWIGANVTITPGVSIADKCIIGAGSVVTKSTGEGEMWFGNPARRIRRVEEGVDKIDWDE